MVLVINALLTTLALSSGTGWAQTDDPSRCFAWSPSHLAQQKKGKEAKEEQGGDKKDKGKEAKDEPGNSQQDKSAAGKGDSEDEDQAKTDDDKTELEPPIKLTLQEQSEIWANLFGGGHRGTSYNGLTTAIVDVDLEKCFGWKKARFYASGFDIHGHGPSRSLAGNNQLISNIEATPSIKLYDLWLEQRFFGNLYLRVGQEGANDEMMTSSYAALFLNSSFGFPGNLAADLPSGGPNYPMATPFVEARWKTTDKLTLVGAVFNGDPAPPGGGDPQIRDRNGTAFRVNGNSLSFAELRYSPDPDAPDTLSTTYKFGSWYHSGRFDDQRFDTAGGLLASPLSSGIARKHRGDFAFYAIADQVLWRREDTKNEGVGVFLQLQGGPSDRNLSQFFAEGGLNWNAPFPARRDDVAGLSFAYLGISTAARQFSRDLVAFGRAISAYASNETIIEATYKAKVNDRLTLQPDAQFVLNPNAHIPGPFGAKPLSNTLVIGVRVTLSLGNN